MLMAWKHAEQAKMGSQPSTPGKNFPSPRQTETNDARYF